MIKTLSIENLILFQRKIINESGGSHGIRDLNLIESWINKAFITFDGVDLYKDNLDKISAITHSLIKNHGFIDGNKRIGVAYMIFLLKLNSINIEYTQEQLIQLALELAQGQKDERDIQNWIKINLK